MQLTLPRSNVRILIVEDHALFAESLELALTMEGYDVRRLPVPESASSRQLRRRGPADRPDRAVGGPRGRGDGVGRQEPLG